MAPLNRKHQRIILALSRVIADYIDRNNGSCEINIAPFAVFFNDDDKNYVEPDISVICAPAKLTDKGCNGAPDWIIEMVWGASSTWTTLLSCSNTVLLAFENMDCRPEKNRILIYNFETEDTELTLPSKILLKWVYTMIYPSTFPSWIFNQLLLPTLFSVLKIPYSRCEILPDPG